jgi:glycosyltransferase involved in cell wall biosynthesis
MKTEAHVKISIIVPIYNVEPYLPDCVDSLINQTFKNIEIILVDDGSPDNCGKICDEYALRDERIRVIHKKNGGLVSARNAGYEASIGNWVMYVDADDWLDIDLCETLARCVTKYEEVDVVFWNNIPTVHNWLKLKWKSDIDEHLYTGNECLELARHTLIYTSGIATAYCKLIRKEFAENNRLFHNQKLRQGVEGIEFSLRVFAHSKKVLFVNECGYHYRFNTNSISKSVNKENTRYIVEGFSEIRQYILRLPGSARFLQAFYQRVLYALVAVTMGTYFHRNNGWSIKFKIRDFQDILNEHEIFREALLHGSFSGMDMYRKITLYAIKCKCYFLIHIISTIKYFIIKR